MSITDANSNQTAFTYDAFGRVTQTNFSSSLSEYYYILAGYKYSPHPMDRQIGTTTSCSFKSVGVRLGSGKEQKHVKIGEKQ